MKIEEAIVNLSIQLEVKSRLGKTQEADAVRLGIEALKRIQWEREHALYNSTALPNEADFL
jgi:hypothetical protein